MLLHIDIVRRGRVISKATNPFYTGSAHREKQQKRYPVRILSFPLLRLMPSAGSLPFGVPNSLCIAI